MARIKSEQRNFGSSKVTFPCSDFQVLLCIGLQRAELHSWSSQFNNTGLKDQFLFLATKVLGGYNFIP